MAMLASTTAVASNTTRPRTPPIFAAEPCLLDVDRSIDPVVRVAIDLPFEDVARGDDELDDSRTLRFFAVCRAPALAESLPPWIAVDDAVRARDVGTIDALPPDEDIAQRSSSWPLADDGANGCLFPLSEAPLAIDCASASEGVSFDTSTMPAGVYEIWGYTFEPPENLWTRRPGLLVVRDGDATAPGADVLSVARRGDEWPPTYSIVGCASGPAELSIEWIDAASAEVFDSGAWMSGLAATVQRGAFELAFTPPADALERGLLLRAIATHGDEQWHSYVSTPLVTLPHADGIEPPDSSGLCATANTDVDDPARETAGCALPTGTPPAAWMLSLLALAHVARHGREPRP